MEGGAGLFLNILFLFVMFPVSLFLYHSFPHRFRSTILLLTSIALLIFWQRENCLLFFALILFTNLCGRYLATLPSSASRTKMLLLFHDGIYLAALFFLRPPHVWSLFGNPLYLTGISILTLQSLSYVHQIAQRRLQPEKVGGRFALYMCFFPKLLFGPYVSYSAFQRLHRRLRCSAEQIGKGLHKMICGLAKVVLLSGQLSLIFQQMQAATTERNTVFFTWMYYGIYFLSFYFQIAGYTDMATGFAACYGYTLPESNRLPLWNRRFSVFLCNWNRTVCKWFLCAFGVSLRKKSFRWLRLILACSLFGWFCRGRMTALLWGLLTGSFLLLSTWMHRKWRFPHVLDWCMVILVGILGWSLFCADTLTEAVSAWGFLFGKSRDLVCYQDLYFLQSSIWLLLIALFCTTGWHQGIKRWLLQRKQTAWLATVFMSVGNVLLLCLSIVAMVSDAAPPLFLQW